MTKVVARYGVSSSFLARLRAAERAAQAVAWVLGTGSIPTVRTMGT